ncbi:MAG: cyclic nucleotide-binding domain-containing protein [Candidatus Latescibacteria bacterium]|nr:cyclic nucleotide-binding domain-containing protein [Candidatus Latescibacterota bacterium]
MNSDLPIMLKTFVPIFQGFSDDDIRAVIQTCAIQKFREGDILFESGSPSTEMLLILSGALLVRTNTGVPLAQLFCPETVGEMGLLTGEPRSATIEGVEDGTVAILKHDDLNRLLNANESRAICLYKNVIDILSVRLRNENFVIKMLRDQVEELEMQQPLPEPAPPKQPIEESEIIADFYQRIGNPSISPEQTERDQQTYHNMRKQGFSDTQIHTTASWAAQNVRGVKAFTLVQYCVDEALKD